MSDEGDATAEAERERQETTAEEATAESEHEDEVVLDVSASEESEAEVDALRETVEQQRERIEELEDLMLDLSVRVADDRAMGVCPECHGPVQKMSRWIRPSTIECRRCGEVFHTY
jgi:hypothetical protein